MGIGGATTITVYGTVFCVRLVLSITILFSLLIVLFGSYFIMR